MADFDWKATVSSVAPTIATALGGPLAGLAVQALGKALGMEGSSVTDLAARVQGASAEDLAKIKSQDQTFKIEMQKLSIDVYALEVKDRESARQMTLKGVHTPAVLSWLIIAATLAMYFWLVKNGNPSGLDDVILGRIMGTLDTSFGVVIAYWLGTSFSSKSKDDTINRMAGTS